MTPECSEEIWEPPGHWHSHACGHPAKWVVLSLGTPVYHKAVCGIHVKKYRRKGRVVGPYQAKT